MGTFQTYQATNLREELQEKINSLQIWKKMPVWSFIKKVRVNSKKPEWLIENLPLPTTANKMVEGADYTYETLDVPSKKNNTTQIFSYPLAISRTQEAVIKAANGKKSEMAYQVGKYMRFLMMDFEWSVINGTYAVGDTSTERELRGMLAWIETNTATSTKANLLTNVQAELQAVFDLGGDVTLLLTTSTLKNYISNNWSITALTHNVDFDKARKLVGQISRFESDFGTVSIACERGTLCPAGTVLGLDETLWEWGILEPMAVDNKIANTGRSVKKALCAQATLVSYNESGNFEITGATS